MKRFKYVKKGFHCAEAVQFSRLYAESETNIRPMRLAIYQNHPAPLGK